VSYLQSLYAVSFHSLVHKNILRSKFRTSAQSMHVRSKRLSFKLWLWQIRLRERTLTLHNLWSAGHC